MTTLAGNTAFNGPGDVAVDGAGNVYVADSHNSTIWKVTPGGVVTTLAGQPGVAGSADGIGTAAGFNTPWGVALDGAGNLYVADSGNNTIRKVTPDGVVTTLGGLAGVAGSADGTGLAARFNYPHGVAVDATGSLYVADSNNDTIRRGGPAGSVPTPVLQAPQMAGGQFGFGITGLPGLAVILESSPDMASWGVLATNILDGGTNYYDFGNARQGNQFYRAIVR